MNLTGEDGRRRDSVEKGIKTLAIGLFVGAVIEQLILTAFFPKLFSFPLVAFWLFIPIHFGNLLCFLILLYLFLLAVGANPKWSAVSSLTFYAFSGAIPLVMPVLTEQLGEAMRLFVLYRDVGLPYIAAATHRLLFPEQATAFATGRAWVFVLLELGIFIWYFVHLCRVLIECSSARLASLKVPAALLLAVIVHAIFVSYYFGRAYWSLMKIVVRA